MRRTSAPKHRIVRRRPGLWMVDRTALQLVDAAQAQLVAVLSDPYGYEAYQLLVRCKHPAAAKRSGQLPTKGELAASLQWPKWAQRKRGRPERSLALPLAFLVVIKRRA